jgi:hypothetical protein
MFHSCESMRANEPSLTGGFCWSVGCVVRVLAILFGRYRSPRAAQAFPVVECPHQQFSVLKSGCCARLHMSLECFSHPHPLHSNTPLLFMSVAAPPAPGLLGYSTCVSLACTVSASALIILVKELIVLECLCGIVAFCCYYYICVVSISFRIGKCISFKLL